LQKKILPAGVHSPQRGFGRMLRRGGTIGKKDLEKRKFLAIFALQTQWGSDPRGSGFLFFMFFKYG
jgi:hypothetical protein